MAPCEITFRFFNRITRTRTLKKKQIWKYRNGAAIVYDDGLTLVTRGGAYGQTLDASAGD